jgi:hypothetical protein
MNVCTARHKQKWIDLVGYFNANFENDVKISESSWVFGLCPSSGILENRKQNVLKLDIFLSSGEGVDT